MDRNDGYPIDDIFSPATPPSFYSNSPCPEEGVYTDDEDERPVEVTCAYCREERQWTMNLRSCNEALEAKVLAAAREKSEMRRSIESESGEATREFNKAVQDYLTEFKSDVSLRQQCDRMGVGIFGGHEPSLHTNWQMERPGAEEQPAGPEMDRA